MHFPMTRGLLQRAVAHVKAVDGISFAIEKGKTLGLVGESGCGKTTTGRCVLRLYQPTTGEILFQGQDIARLKEREIRPLRRMMQLVFQDPFGSLNPRRSAGNIVGAPLLVHKLVSDRQAYRNRVAELFLTVGLDPRMMDRVPHEFSGGQRQRIGIARALACEPLFIVCDEPVSALDVSIQAQVINLLKELQQKFNLTYLFIAHDLSVVRHISDHVAVMYLGRIVELTDWKSLYEDPLHPYTQALLAAIPIPDPFIEENRQLVVLEGDIPSPVNPPAGCAFHPRCPMAIKECRATLPVLREVAAGHHVACIRV